MKKQRKLSNIKCPKCKKKPRCIFEITEGALEYILEDNKYIYVYKNDGDIIGMKAQCECGYIWRLRGVLQIIEFADYDMEIINDETQST